MFRSGTVIALVVAVCGLLPSAAFSAVGRTPGLASVSATGAANYSIPFQVPAGTRDLTPSLGLSYSSDVGHSIAGVGWTISGLSVIERCASTVAQDGAVRSVRLDLLDQYCLDGQRLRLASGTHGTAGATYRTEVESFSRITAYGAAGNGPAYFVAEGADGRIYEYGNSADSRIESLGVATARTWALNKIRDRQGNQIVFTYDEDATNGAFRINSVAYAGNPVQGVAAPYTVTFSYESKPSGEVDSRYVAGGLVKETTRLNMVQVYGTTIVRRYVLAYETGLSSTSRSRLASVQECAGLPLDCFAATSFVYQNGSIGLAGEVNTGVSVPATTTWTVDVNGDGREDVVYPSSATSGSGTWLIMFATGSGTYGAPVNTGITNTNYSGSTPIDYNADGKIDLLVPLSGSWNVLLGTATGFAAPVNTGAPVTATGSGDNARAMDIDGDGLEDLVWADLVGWGGGDAIRYRRHVPGGAFDTTVQTLVGPAEPMTKIVGMSFAPYGRPADINGDGRADIVYRYAWREFSDNNNAIASPTDADAPPVAVDGTSVLYVERYSINVVCPGAGAFDSSTSTATAAAYFGDFNGDGKTDLWYKNGNDTWSYRYSTGLGLKAGQSGSPSTAYTAGWVVKDWDGDGYDDLITPNLSTGAWDLFRSTGEAFQGPLATGTSFASGSNTFRATDVNGDGHLDLAYRTSTNAWRYRLHTSDPALPDLLKSAQDGFGVKADFGYQPITNAAVYTKGSGAIFPIEDVQFGRWVVSQLLQSDGSGTTATYATDYAYEAARRHRQGREFLGFTKRTSIDRRLGYDLKTIETYRQDFPFIGALASAERQQSSGTRIELITNTWAKLDYGTGYTLRSYPYVASSTLDQHEVAGASNGMKYRSITTAVASGGLDATSGTVMDQTTTVTESATGLFPGSYRTERIHHTALLNDTTNWCLGRPTASELTRSHTLNGGTPITRTTDATWNGPNCRMSQFRVQPGDPTLAVTVSLQYDAFGNLTSQGVAGAGMAARTTTLGWDASGRYVTAYTNALGQASNLTWDAARGVPTSVTDPNGITTSWSYDAFGRQTLETRPDGTSTLWTYQTCASCDSRVRLELVKQDRDTTAVAYRVQNDYFDNRDRLIWQKDQHLDANDTVWSVRREFDARGRLAKDYAPYLTSGADNGYRSLSYDPIDRVAEDSSYRAGGALERRTSTVWGGLTWSETDLLAHTTTHVTSAWGALLRVTDAASGRTDYEYDAFDALRKVTDPNGTAVAQYAYNVRGMTTQVSDVDRGTTILVPNALGEVTARTSAKGQTASYTYDSLGRLVQRTEPEGTSTWTWGNSGAARNIGRLQGVAGPGYSESYAYDAYGRLATQSVVADASYQFDYAYNATTGLLETLTYPLSTAGPRFKVKYGYSGGRLSSIQDYTTNVNGAILWNLNLLDARAHAISETYANGLWMQSTYDALTGAPLTRKSGTGGSDNNVQNLSYAWDTAGNLTGRSDLRQGLAESFSYDALDRMTSSVGPQTTSIGYDAIGNITSKSGIGAYSYDATRKHAVVTAGATGYGYDANGNMNARGGAAVTWTSDDLPLTIGDPSGFSAQFAYAPDRRRWRQVASYANGTETTIYIAGLLEKLTTSSSGRTHWKHLVATPAGQIQVIRRSDASSDILYFATDHLGSADVVTNSAATVVARLSYTVHGARRNSATWSGAPSSAQWLDIAGTTRRGFTGHEHLDNVLLVHMNGRVFDPQLGRFLSADPFVDGAVAAQGWNRYGYTRNNLLGAVDPTGQSSNYIAPSLDLRQPLLDGVETVTTTASRLTGGAAGGPSPRGGSGTAGSEPREPFAIEFAVLVEATRLRNHDSTLVIVMAQRTPQGRQSDPRCTKPLPDGSTPKENAAKIRDRAWRAATDPFDDGAGIFQAYGYWLWSVLPNGQWDYKRHGGTDEDGNFNYGATGRVLFSGEVLGRAAGAIQLLYAPRRSDGGNPFGKAPYGDQWRDQEVIAAGAAGCP